MKIDERKTARAAYKERKTVAGIFAVRCAASGQIWVGQAPDLATIQNRLWFILRHGSSPHRSLQSAWTAYGPDSLAFEEVERLAEEDVPYLRQAALKERLAYWRDELGAERL